MVRAPHETLRFTEHSGYNPLRYATLYDRADLYVAFIEHGLSLLGPTGVLGYVCADRWIANKYGSPLRRMIAAEYAVRVYVDLHTATPFESTVVAYPSIIVIGRGKTGSVPVVTLESATPNECQAVVPAILAGKSRTPGVVVSQYTSWFQNDDPWVLSSPDLLAILRRLECRFAPIEATAKVGIGVATGNDDLYLVPASVDIEPDRLVPVVMRSNLEHGRITNAHRFVINTFEDHGSVVDLARYPRLQRYIAIHSKSIRKRHVAEKNPRSWFRTIDRVYPDLVAKPKLLIPDIAGSNQVVFDEGHYHPHHNLYFITSEAWDLEVLGGLISSRVALFFVWSYAVKMRGGYLRFQAQYLRRIRLPSPSDVPAPLQQRLRAAFRNRNFTALDELSLRAYQLETLPPFEFVDSRS